VDESKSEEKTTLHNWKARKLQPVVILYVIAVFLGFIAVAFFVFHSTEAVFALATTSVASVVPLLPGVLTRLEYQFTEAGLRKGSAKATKDRTFKEVFTWEELSHVVPTKQGFKFFRVSEGTGRFRRFWETHLSEKGSGEFHVEPRDREEVLSVLAHHGIPTSKQIRHTVKGS